jgi:hypothetical protein
MMHRLSVRVLTILTPLVLAVGLSIGYTLQVDRQSDRDNEQNDRKWCALLVTMDDAYRSAPPTTPTGMRLADAIRQLRTGLGC